MGSDLLFCFAMSYERILREEDNDASYLVDD